MRYTLTVRRTAGGFQAGIIVGLSVRHWTAPHATADAAKRAAAEWASNEARRKFAAMICNNT